MIIEKIREDMNSARKGSDSVAKNLLITLFSEITMVGKNLRNGPTTDEESISTIKKFAANVEETISLLKARSQDSTAQEHELEILITYLPQQMTRDAMIAAVSSIASTLNVSGPKAMGPIMAALKTQFVGKYDGKMASSIVKEILNN